MIFSETINLLNEVKQFSTDEVEKLISILDNEALLPEHFFEMTNNFSVISNSIPNNMYMDNIEITNKFTSELLELGRLNDDSNKHEEVGLPHLVVIIINLNLTYKLEQLGLFGEAHNALLRAKDPWVSPFDPSTKIGDYYLSRVQDIDRYLLDLFPVFPTLIRDFFVKRGAISFRLSKIMGDVGMEAKAVYKTYKMFATFVNPNQYDLMFFTNYLDLISSKSARDVQDFKDIVDSLTNHYSTEKDANYRFIIASSLAINLKSLEWTKKAAAETSTYYWAELIHMKVLEACHAESIDGSRLIELLWDFMMKSYSLFQDRTMFELIKQKYSVIFTQILVTCIEKNELHLFLSLTYNWNCFRPGKKGFQYIENKNLFVTVPNFGGFDGTIFLIKYEDEIIFIPITSDVKLEDIMELKSRVEASWYALIGSEITLSFEEESIKSREQLQLSKEYVKAIEKFIGIEELKKCLVDLPSQINFEYLETSWTNTPIVSVLANNTQHTFTITGGNEHYLIPQGIKNVLIWCDPDGSLYKSKFELDGIRRIFTINEVDVEIFTGSNCTKEVFLEKYSDQKYDLIWIISHGQFNSNNPPQSTLDISKTEKVTAWELQKLIPSLDKRRYLILNACYSGCANVRYNSMGFLGIGPSSTNENQIVLGHLWFVDTLAAGVLGILTLSSLMLGESLQSSLKKASLVMNEGNTAILDALNTIDPNLEMIEHMQRTSQELNLPFYSMSGVVFE